MKIRLDQLIVERGLAETRERAQGLIRAGQVIVGEHRIDKPGTKVAPDAEVRLKGEICPYVSRGGLKLEGALRRLDRLDLKGRRALDIGASTGGFTDCLLTHGVEHVWAIDTGRGQFHQKLRDDTRVTLREQANARYLEAAWLGGERADLATIDVSFISLKLILPALAPVLADGAEVIALVKPQFEAGREEVPRGGVVRDARVHHRVLRELAGWTVDHGWGFLGLCRSTPPGPAGNREFFLHLRHAQESERAGSDAIEIAIERVLTETYNESRSERA